MPRGQADPVLGEVLRYTREDRPMKREEVAAAAGLTISTVGSIERGESDPSWSTLKAMCSALGITFVELARRVEAAGGAVRFDRR